MTTKLAAQPDAAVALAADAPRGWRYDRWPALLGDCLVAVSGRFDAGWERAAVTTANAAGTALLSIRAIGGEAQIGPVRPAASCGADGSADDRGQPPAYGCAGCAHSRDQAAVSAGSVAGLGQLVDAYLAALATAPLPAGELVTIRSDGSISRHKIARADSCPVCADPVRIGLVRTGLVRTGPAEPASGRAGTTPPAARPGLGALPSRPASGRLPVRGAPPFGLDPALMRRELAGRRYGPVVSVRRNGRAPFAMTEATVLGARHPGYGRGRTFRTADAVAILEAWERAGCTPPPGTSIIRHVSRRELGGAAMDPAGLGRYAPQQLAAPGCQLRGYQPDAPLDWVWGHRLSDGDPALVPAEIGFYRYAYPPDPGDGAARRPCFEDSSSGSALGGSYEEAALHSLIELAERDAFLLAWHQAVPRPRLDLSTVADPQCTMLIDLISDRGYDLHLLVVTADIQIPVVWALAVQRELGFPATLSAAGASPDPVEAVRSALWELGQLVSSGQQLDQELAQALSADPWLITRLDDHVLVNALPQVAQRTLSVLGGPAVPLRDAFAGWPQRLTERAGGDVTGALRYLAGAFADAGLSEIFVVDQSSQQHHDLGLAVVKAVVPGITPMCFGQAHQRLAGIPRLARAIERAGRPFDEACVPFDPHPFP